uniref:CID domain-containing protein n=1 Tax=Auxenochlorella protothecoides TaxID=3075 RepID=A0A1D1ZPQ8_AUXPR
MCDNKRQGLEDPVPETPGKRPRGTPSGGAALTWSKGGSQLNLHRRAPAASYMVRSSSQPVDGQETETSATVPVGLQELHTLAQAAPSPVTPDVDVAGREAVCKRFEGLLGCLTRSKDSIRSTALAALDSAGSGTTSQIICIILEQAERWQDAHSQVNLLYLLDAILQHAARDGRPELAGFKRAIGAGLLNFVKILEPDETTRDTVFKVISSWGRKQLMPEVLIQSALASIHPVEAPPEEPAETHPAATATPLPPMPSAVAPGVDTGRSTALAHGSSPTVPRERSPESAPPVTSGVRAVSDESHELDKFMAEVFEGMRGAGRGNASGARGSGVAPSPHALPRKPASGAGTRSVTASSGPPLRSTSTAEGEPSNAQQPRPDETRRRKSASQTGHPAQQAYGLAARPPAIQGRPPPTSFQGPGWRSPLGPLQYHQAMLMQPMGVGMGPSPPLIFQNVHAHFVPIMPPALPPYTRPPWPRST